MAPIGSRPNDDSNGSLLFGGTFTELAWRSNNNNPGDGMSIQLAQASAAVPEPSSFLIFCLGAVGFAGLKNCQQKRRLAS
jgi:hypothetical protein